MSTIIGAVVQAGTPLFDKKRTLEKFKDLFVDAAKTKAELVVFPEAFIGGYPKGIDFGVRMGSRSDEGREMFRLSYENAIDIPGPDLEVLSDAVHAAGVHAVVGAIERDGGTLYCSALFFNPEGKFIGKHRKVMPTALERVTWGTGDGSTLIAPKTDIGILGSVICWENYLPQLRLCMYARAWSFTVPRPWMSVKSGCRPCRPSLLKDDALC